MPPTCSLVVPIFNEEAVIAVLLKRLDVLLEALDARAEVIVVDDGSRDSSAIVIEAKARADKRYWLINCRAISAIRSRSPSSSIAPRARVIVICRTRPRSSWR
jgi:glycosyltransferase involved in cell wall biosynthesis